MKRLLMCGLLTIILIFAVHTHPIVVYAEGQWITTDKIWDDNRPQPNETFTWSGGHDNDGYATGYGVLQWYVDGENDNRYEGNMSRGKINGEGRCTFASGNYYEGDWIDGRRTGKGVFTWQNGNCYEGDFVKDLRTGKGVMVYANGDRYEGDWVDGQRTGKGIMVYANGDRYEGDWVSEQKTGKGIMIFADGRRWEGNWTKGGFSKPQENYGYFFLVFLIIAAIAAWISKMTLKDGNLSWRLMLKYTSIYTIFTIVTAFLLDFRFLEQIIDSIIADIGLNNPVLLFFILALIVAAAVGFNAEGSFSRRNALICFAVYATFTMALYVIWYLYVIIMYIRVLLGMGR